MPPTSQKAVIPSRPKPAQLNGHPTMAAAKDQDGEKMSPPSLTIFTLSNGCPIEDPLVGEQVRTSSQPGYASQLMQDLNVIDTLSHVTRERIPERYVHAKGAGACGYFEAMPDSGIEAYTDAKFLQPPKDAKGPRTTDLVARFSTVAGERGYPETVRDLKGAAFKLYTQEGNLDWAFLNPDVFTIRDPVKFPSAVHATKRDPRTNLPDPNMFWDYFNNHPEGFNTLMRLFSDEGTPKSYSRMKISSVNTYTFTKKIQTAGEDGEPQTKWKSTFVRLRLDPSPDFNIDDDCFSLEQATTMAGKDPDYLARRLYEEILNDDFKNQRPTWTVSAQILDAKIGVDIFDATKTMDYKDHVKEIPIGRIVLNGIPDNFFTHVEQVAFNPANIVPGWDISPDPVLQIRLFMYGDTQRYRLGVNHDQLPVNKPTACVWTPTRRDGAHNVNNYGSHRNYLLQDESSKPDNYSIGFLEWDNGKPVRFKSEVTDNDWQQCAEHWNKSLSPTQRLHFICNVASSLSTATIPVQDKTLVQFGIISKWIDPEHPDAFINDLTKALRPMARKNAKHHHKPGVIAGGEEAQEMNYIPPSVPNPATGSQEIYKVL